MTRFKLAISSVTGALELPGSEDTGSLGGVGDDGVALLGERMADDGVTSFDGVKTGEDSTLAILNARRHECDNN
jgi:hypothetical protein